MRGRGNEKENSDSLRQADGRSAALGRRPHLADP